MTRSVEPVEDEAARMVPQRILVAYKKSRYDLYSNSPDEEVRRYLQTPDGQRLYPSHVAHHQSLDTVLDALDRMRVPYDARWRGDVKSIDGYDLLVTVGGDGTFLDIARRIDHRVDILGVNSDPGPSHGYFCATTADGFAAALEGLDRLPRTVLWRLCLDLDGQAITEAINDVEIENSDRPDWVKYRMVADGVESKHRSDKLLVSTPQGDTGWIHNYGGHIRPLGDTRLQYGHIGEEWPPRCGLAQELMIVSNTREGRMHIDCGHKEYPFTLGQTLRLRTGKPLAVLGDLEGKRAHYRAARA